jgi:hypothetical protein
MMEPWREDLLALLDEAYVAEAQPTTWFKDYEPRSSVAETLDQLSVEAACRPPLEGRYPVAAHARHLTLSLEALANALQGHEWRMDWEASWHLPPDFDESQWSELRTRLRRSYAAVEEGIRARDDWSDFYIRRGTLSALAHAAYHLGAIRQIAAQELIHAT